MRKMQAQWITFAVVCSFLAYWVGVAVATYTAPRPIISSIRMVSCP